MDKLDLLKKIAQEKFSDIILDIIDMDYKVRIILIDKSFIDINVSAKFKGRFSFHWQCKDKSIYRYDNFPDKRARCLKSFPFHFHTGSQENIQESPFSSDLEEGFKDFMNFIRINLQGKRN